jgi:quercetin dioxygenase-like cupin family protein
MNGAREPRPNAGDASGPGAGGPGASGAAPRECEWRESAVAHVLGTLPASDEARFVEHAASCVACAAEVEQAQIDVAAADEALAREASSHADAPAPSASVRERLMAAVQAADVEVAAVEVDAVRNATNSRATGLDRSWVRWGSAAPAGASTEGFSAGMYAVARDAGEWAPVGIPGIEVKRLATDPERREVTMLVRMAAGTAYPAHRHGGVEECLVLSGEILVGERPMKAGDYQISQRDSVHPVQSTREGCLLYIRSSQDDELLGV